MNFRDFPEISIPNLDLSGKIGKVVIKYSRLALSQNFKGPGDLFEIEKDRDIESLTK